MRKAIYAGTFDPITNGHLDIIQRACQLFDQVYVVIFDNPNKKTLFSLDQRIRFIKESTNGLNVIVDYSESLVVEYAHKVNAQCIVRGLRATQDYHYESMMAYCNQYLDESIEMIFLMTKLSYTFISSSAVKEMASHLRDVTPLVPECVSQALIDQYKSEENL